MKKVNFSYTAKEDMIYMISRFCIELARGEYIGTRRQNSILFSEAILQIIIL